MNRLRNEIAPGIILYDKAIDGDLIVSIVEQENSNSNSPYEWEWSGTGTNNNKGDYRTSYSFPLINFLEPNNQHEHRETIMSEVIGKLSIAYNDYTSRYLVETGYTEPPVVLKYIAGGRYRTHTDAGPGMHRVVSCVGSLGNSSTGGELDFPLLNIRVKLEKNQLLFFPANFIYQHYAHPVVDGIKYSIVTWWGA
jgi:hypothetical protein